MKIWLVILTVLFLVSTTTAAVTDTSVTGITASSATLWANTTSSNFSYYFDIGTSSGAYSSRTSSEYQTETGEFSYQQKGYPLFPDTTYYIRPVVSTATTEYGPETHFTTSTHPTITQQDEVSDISDRLWSIVDADYDLMVIGDDLIGFWTDTMGTLFFGLIFSIVFLALWIRMADITIPLLIGLLTGTTLIGLMPPEWQSIGYALFAVSLAGFIYMLYKKRRVES